MTTIKRGMKVYAPDGSELMEISGLARSGSNLVLQGKIMGAMPMKAVIKPAEARCGLQLLNLKIVLFLLTFMFRQ